MMSLVVVDGDALAFEPQFGDRMVTLVDPPMIRGTGLATIGGVKVCIEGDEAKVRLKAIYSTSTYTVPGNGIVTIKALDSSQMASGCTSPMSVITKGRQKFTASFTPAKPAMTPSSPSTADAAPPSDGKGEFVTSQNWVQAG
ncbi:hypothetical protein WM04_13490 [Burkholderia ubonensis]|uniref:hypothetical protein n=1 Tax=Burkholderia ubonensis TaxID=101571 RepID=UPI0007538792|nr:hypothetical protein [Burkholderia ubonensis]KWI32623.1 hypothetical protein WM04_13490 [Burkholderia ubonensis]KWK57636.1 hypothetical protein WM15_17090 [Burkholderia ubonensis]OJB13509.1 hypothetical protein BGV53_25365 [Burkholderia ubonensis]